MPYTSDSKFSEYASCLLDLNEPLAKRTHCAFHLRTIGSEEAAHVIMEALKNRQDGSLMRHELAYILGQMQFTSVCPLLSQILDTEGEDVLVRHECAEALGALITGPEYGEFIDILRKYSTHELPEISETCQIALDLISWREQKENQPKSAYLSVDPAPAFPVEHDAKYYRDILLDKSASLFVRYRAMFSLRNLNTDEAVAALVEGFSDSSALFRHEIAYVLGQMQMPSSIDGLSQVLINPTEHRMVRHEAAEALGAVGGKRVEELLEQFKNDVEPVVNESCQVALDTIDYWSN